MDNCNKENLGYNFTQPERKVPENRQVFAPIKEDMSDYANIITNLLSETLDAIYRSDTENFISIYPQLENSGIDLPHLICKTLTNEAIIRIYSNLNEMSIQSELITKVKDKLIHSYYTSRITQDQNCCKQVLIEQTNKQHLYDALKNLFSYKVNTPIPTLTLNNFSTTTKIVPEFHRSNNQLIIVLNIAGHNFPLRDIIEIIKLDSTYTQLPYITENDIDHFYIYNHFFDKEYFQQNCDAILTDIKEDQNKVKAALVLLFAYHDPEFAEEITNSSQFSKYDSFWQASLGVLSDYVQNDYRIIMELLQNRENYKNFANIYQDFWNNFSNYEQYHNHDGYLCQSANFTLELFDDIAISVPVTRQIDKDIDQIFIGQINFSNSYLANLISYHKSLDGLLKNTNLRENKTENNELDLDNPYNWQVTIYQEQQTNAQDQSQSL